MVDKDEMEFLLTEYEQAGEEYRTRHRLLHNSYYLLVVALFLFAGTLLSVLEEPLKLSLILIITGSTFLLLGLVIITHYVERQSAAVLRDRSEKAVEQFTNATINHGVEIQRPLGIQYHIIGRASTYDDSNNLITRNGKYRVLLTKPELSAKTVGQIVVLLSLTFFVFGGWKLYRLVTPI